MSHGLDKGEYMKNQCKQQNTVISLSFARYNEMGKKMHMIKICNTTFLMQYMESAIMVLMCQCRILIYIFFSGLEMFVISHFLCFVEQCVVHLERIFYIW